MNVVWSIPELRYYLAETLRELEEYHGDEVYRATLASLVTNRSFWCPALDNLWHTLPDLDPIFRILPVMASPLPGHELVYISCNRYGMF